MKLMSMMGRRLVGNSKNTSECTYPSYTCGSVTGGVVLKTILSGILNYRFFSILRLITHPASTVFPSWRIYASATVKLWKSAVTLNWGIIGAHVV